MALLADGKLTTIEELDRYDSSVLQVAHIEGLNLTGIISLVDDDIRLELETELARPAANGSPVNYRSEQIVATEHLRRWHLLRVLEHAYRDAYFSQLNDRYGGKWREYQRLAREAQERLWNTGIGLTPTPLRRPEAPSVTLEFGFTPANSYFVTAAWVGAGGQESGLSETTVVSAPSNHSLRVDLGDGPLTATGWNVYAGQTAEAISRQNEEPLTKGESWIAPPSGLIRGEAATGGQVGALLFFPAHFMGRR